MSNHVNTSWTAGQLAKLFSYVTAALSTVVEELDPKQVLATMVKYPKELGQLLHESILTLFLLEWVKGVVPDGRVFDQKSVRLSRVPSHNPLFRGVYYRDAKFTFVLTGRAYHLSDEDEGCGWGELQWMSQNQDDIPTHFDFVVFPKAVTIYPSGDFRRYMVLAKGADGTWSIKETERVEPGRYAAVYLTYKEKERAVTEAADASPSA